MVRQLTSLVEMMWNYNQGEIEQQNKFPATFWFLCYGKEGSGASTNTWLISSYEVSKRFSLRLGYEK